jgi:predicted nucleotidyltransferase
MPVDSSRLLNPDYEDMAKALLDANVEFMLVGGFAVSVHGYPRTTFDIDFWVRPTPLNAQRVLLALQIFGAPMQDVSASDFDHPDMVFQIGVAPRRIDILTKIDGVSWDEASPHAIREEIDGLAIPVVGLEDLIRNKRATGRIKDAADAAALEKLAARR